LPTLEFEANELALILSNGTPDQWKIIQTFPFAD